MTNRAPGREILSAHQTKAVAMGLCAQQPLTRTKLERHCRDDLLHLATRCARQRVLVVTIARWPGVNKACDPDRQVGDG